eukprot:TRINITY_DN4903_c0_g1_i1.p1 TRINITY_DN4903_c0_g1~~TRINITY_DN4903_c0_g1_i1.p1  ORF type:complete len:415 (-),score=73.87 TRINITY_DN4903_c0_g1_i1:10-1227(-)
MMEVFSPTVDEFITNINISPLNVSPEDGASAVSSRKGKFKRVTRACIGCQQGHTSCDKARPCNKCIEKGRDCVDGVYKKRGRKKRGEEETVHPIHQHEPTTSTSHIYATNPALYNETLDESTSFTNLMGMLRDNSVLDLPEETINMFSEVFLTPYEQPAKKAKIQAAERYVTLHLARFHRRQQILKSRVPELADKLATRSMIIVSTLKMLQESMDTDTLQLIEEESANELAASIRKFEDMGCCVLCWEKGGTIVWVNQAYRDLTGFNAPIAPSEDILNQVTYMEEMDDAGLRQVLLAASKTLMGKRSYNVHCAMKNYRRVGPDFIPGVLSVTMKMSVTGPPLLSTAVFIPTDIETISPDGIDWHVMDMIFKQKCDEMTQNLETTVRRKNSFLNFQDETLLKSIEK